jgi:hypothetical protein
MRQRTGEGDGDVHSDNMPNVYIWMLTLAIGVIEMFPGQGISVRSSIWLNFNIWFQSYMYTFFAPVDK